MTDWMPLGWMWVMVGLWGALWGSFANVVIARMPEGQSIAWPASHCFSCKTPIRWYDNLPLVSWFVLKGRCRACGAFISWRYPLIELGGVVCSLAAAWAVVGGSTHWRLVETPALEIVSAWMLLTFFFLILMMLTAIDLKHLLLPHRLTGSLAIFGFLYAWIVPTGGDWRGFVPSLTVGEAVLGFVVAYGALFLFAFLYSLLRGRQGMGGGDFMLFGALGAWFGVDALPMLMLLAALQGVLLYALALVFFPSLIHEIRDDDEAFWAGRAGAGPLEAKGPHASETPVEKEEERRGASSAAAEIVAEASAATARGVAFGPFLCLAAVEFVAFGGLYLRWLNGGF